MATFLKWTAIVAVAVVAFLFLAPTSIGGNASYIKVEGTSMEPNLYTGDLVVLQKRGSYRLGDAVAFRSSFAGAVVLHRIIEVYTDANGRQRYVLQGDNNNFVDVDEPTDDDILGKQVLRIPNGAGATEFLRSPVGLGVMFALAGLLIFASLVFGVKQSRHRRKH